MKKLLAILAISLSISAQATLTPPSSSGAVGSVNGQSGEVVLDTDDIDEGSREYHTTARARAACVDDTAYDATSWNSVTNQSPSKNSVRDQIETMLTSIAGKEPAIASGTTAQYLRGDKSLSTFATDVQASVNDEALQWSNKTITDSILEGATVKIRSSQGANDVDLLVLSGASFGDFSMTIYHDPSADRLIALQDKDGTLAMHEDFGASGLFEKRLRKTADQSNSTVNAADVSGLTVALAASQVIRFEAMLFMSSAATTTGIQLGVNGPTSPTEVFAEIVTWSTTTARADTFVTAFESFSADTASQGNVIRLCKITGYVRNGSNTGTFALRFRSEVGSSAVVVENGSWLDYTLN